jgi:hypothetical protein
MLDWLCHPALAQHAADAFYVILNEYPDVMTLAQHGKVMFLYRQRVFVLTLPQLKGGYQTANTGLLPLSSTRDAKTKSFPSQNSSSFTSRLYHICFDLFQRKC